MQYALASGEQERRRQFRRLLAVSAGAHLLLGGLFALAPHPAARVVDLPAVVQVDLVSMPARSAPSRPAPAKPLPKPKPKEPEPPPEPEPPKPKEVVLPAHPTPPKPAPKPKAAPKPTPKPKAAPAEEDYEDVLADLRKEVGQAHPAPADAKATAHAGGVGVLVSPEEMAWRRRAKQHVTQAWVLAQGFRTQNLTATVDVDLGSAGEVRSTHLVRSSGNPWFDDSVERALRKASPLPAPPEAGTWTFSFHPGDVY